jgi:regulator of cell morphogenesis and NO signaling
MRFTKLKKMNEFKNKTASELVIENYLFSNVFNKYGIDYLNDGNIEIKELCKNNKHLDICTIEKELKNIRHSGSSMNFNHLNEEGLCNYIINTQHKNCKKKVNDVLSVAQIIYKKEKVKPFNEIFINATKLSIELNSHMEKEEKFLFPFIKKISAKKTNEIRKGFNVVNYPINLLKKEHLKAIETLEKLLTLSGKYKIECQDVSLLNQKIGLLKNDLHLHIHLENNILFKKILKLEQIRTNHQMR